MLNKFLEKVIIFRERFNTKLLLNSYMNKRGISPLIATVLLVAFAVALAGIVSTYVISKTKEFKPEAIVEDSLLCDEVNLGFSVDSDLSNVKCDSITDSTDVKYFKGLKLKNKGGFTIHKYQITYPGMGTSPPSKVGVYSSGNFVPDDTGLIPNEEHAYYFAYLTDPGSIFGDEFKITPIIKDPETGNEVICTKRQLVIKAGSICNDLGYANDPNVCVGCSPDLVPAPPAI